MTSFLISPPFPFSHQAGFAFYTSETMNPQKSKKKKNEKQ